MNHFDSRAAEWDNNPGRVENSRKIAAAIKKSVPLSRNMSALEFGCGTGLVSRELYSEIACPEQGRRGKIMAVDLSPGMIEQFQQRITDAGLQNITAQCRDILSDPPVGPFDLIYSAMVMHHVPDTDALLDALVKMTASGGWIALADLDTEDGTFHEDSTEPLHPGFEREEIMRKLCERGLTETAAVMANIIHKNDRDYPVFLITARKPAA